MLCATWFSETAVDTWVPMPMSAAQLDAAKVKGGVHRFELAELVYDVDMNAMTQTNMKSGSVRRIKCDDDDDDTGTIPATTVAAAKRAAGATALEPRDGALGAGGSAEWVLKAAELFKVMGDTRSANAERELLLERARHAATVETMIAAHKQAVAVEAAKGSTAVAELRAVSAQLQQASSALKQQQAAAAEREKVQRETTAAEVARYEGARAVKQQQWAAERQQLEKERDEARDALGTARQECIAAQQDAAGNLERLATVQRAAVEAAEYHSGWLRSLVQSVQDIASDDSTPTAVAVAQPKPETPTPGVRAPEAARWFLETQKGWAPIGTAQCAVLDGAMARGGKHQVTMGAFTYLLDMDAMTQCNMSTGKIRRLKVGTS